MMLQPVGRKYQIDYITGLRYVFSPAYRAEVRKTWGQNTGSRILYTLGSLVTTTVVISALLLLVFAIQGLLR